MTSTYSNVTDLFVGDITVDDTIKQNHVDRAADEVDSRLGFLYVTPFVEGDISRPGWLLIQRLANFIASGRLLLEIDQAGEQQMIHAYGKRLLDDAEATIQLILSGQIDLRPQDPTEIEVPAINGAKVVNLDPYSQVEAFYGWAAIPGYNYSGFGGWPNAH